MKFVQGQKVWVVERDETTEPVCVSGVVFIEQVWIVAIVHPFLGGCGELYSILRYCLEETRESYGCGISVYPIGDCYESRESAEAAMEAEMREY